MYITILFSLAYCYVNIYPINITGNQLAVKSILKIVKSPIIQTDQHVLYENII